MNVIDGTFISLYCYFKDTNKAKYSSTEDYTVYAFSMGVLLWAMTIVYFLRYSFGVNYFNLNLLLAFIIVGSAYEVLKSRYIKNGFFLKLESQFYNLSQKQKNRHKILAFLFILFPLLLMLIMLILKSNKILPYS